MRLAWSEPALADLVEIRRHIAEDNPAAARRVAERIKAAVRQLATYPHLGRPGREPGTRELAIPGTPYVVPYTVHRGRLAILAVLHGAQQWPRD